jgi:hypothetical protein
MTVITMSRKELGRLQTLIDLADGRLAVEDAAALMGLGRRQVYRLLISFRANGTDALVSKRRGKPSNHTTVPSSARPCWASCGNAMGTLARRSRPWRNPARGRNRTRLHPLSVISHNSFMALIEMIKACGISD